MTRRTLDAYQRWAAIYDTDPNPQTTLEVDGVLRVLDSAPTSFVLDAACGTGRYLPHLLERAERVVGFDFAPAMLRKARARHPQVPLVRADLMGGLPFPSGLFSCVLCTQTLKHCADLGRPARELFRVLRPGGVLVFSVTHPDADFEGYEMRERPAFLLALEADIFHHRRDDYFGALSLAGFERATLHDIVVTEAIAHLLTPGSFARVRGRPQVAIFEARKPRGGP